MSVGGLLLALAWIAGTVLALHVPLPAWTTLLLGLASIPVGIRGRGTPVRLGALVLGVAALAVARVGFGATTPVYLDQAGTAVLVGRVGDVAAPLGERVAFPIDVTALGRAGETPVDLDAEPAPRVMVRAARADLTIGDLVAVEGRLSRPRSRPGWPEAELLARRGIGTVVDATRVRVLEPAGPGIRATLERLRRHLDATIHVALPDPHASLVAGVVLGSRGGLPPELREALSTTGTSHVVAASGFNVAVVGGVVLAVVVRLVGHPWALLPTLLAVWAYAVLVGASPSVIRAALMASFGIGALALGRLSDAPTALALAAALMVAWDPWIVFDLGFQLSALATAGLVLFATPIADRLRPLPRLVRDAVGATLAAEAATLPIVLGTFQTLSLVGPLANAAVLPAIPALTIVGAALSALGDVPGPGTALAWAAWTIAAYVLAVVEWCARLPGAAVSTGQLPGWFPVGWYAALCLVAVSRSPELGTRLGSMRGARLGAAAGALSLAVAPLLILPRSDATTISLLDVGAPAAFVRAPGGRTLLVTADATPSQLGASLADRLGFWERGIDVAVALRADDRTRAALDGALGRYPASTLVLPADGSPAEEGLVSGGRVAAERGLRIELEPGTWLDVINVRIEDERPVADVLIVTDGLAVWLPGPGGPSPRWSEAPSDVPTIVRLPGRSPRWLGEARPARLRAVIGDGLQRFDETDLGVIPVLDHAAHGAVEITIEPDGATLDVERCADAPPCRVDDLQEDASAERP